MGGALAATRSLGGLLFGVAGTDPATYAVVTGVLLAAGVVACWLPARRAARTNPLEALRQE
jgi:ABC-type antimicrobial peptide transport system permease subunit